MLVRSSTDIMLGEKKLQMCSLGENPRFFCVHLGMSERTWWCNKVFRGWTKMERDGVYNGQISSLRWNTASGILSLEFSLSCRHKKSMISNFVQESTFRWRQTATCCTSGGEWLCLSDKNLSERWWKPLNSKLHSRTWSVCVLYTGALVLYFSMLSGLYSSKAAPSIWLIDSPSIFILSTMWLISTPHPPHTHTQK